MASTASALMQPRSSRPQSATSDIGLPILYAAMRSLGRFAAERDRKEAQEDMKDGMDFSNKTVADDFVRYGIKP